MFPPSPSRIALIVCLLILSLSACAPGALDEQALGTAQSLAGTYIAQTQTAWPTDTTTPSSTPSPTPTFTLTSTNTPTSTPTATSSPQPTLGSSAIYLNIYLIPTDADGPVGCGDQMVAFSTGVLPTGHAETDVRAALERLFNLRVQYQYGAYNPLYLSSLIITSVQYEEALGEINARTTGNLVRGEKGCEWDMIRNIVKATVNNASGGQSVNVSFNGHAFNDLVSSDR